MKIAFFTENYRCGGLDTFLISLFNNWPCDDELTLICNSSHPGIKNIKQRTQKELKLVEHDIFTFHVAAKWKVLNKIPKILRRVVLLLILVFAFPYQVYKTRKILQSTGADRLLVVNGGYPAGYTCLAATIAWGLIKDKEKAWHNFHNYAEKPHPMLWLWGNLLDYLVKKLSKGFVTVSHGCGKSMINRPLLKNQHIKVIYNGIETPVCKNEINIRKELGLSEDEKVCLMLATYEPRKGHKYLLEAFKVVDKKVSKVSLVICGDRTDEELKQVQNWVDEFVPHASVFLLPYRSEASDLINQADLLVVPSQSFESFGLTNVEAMALKTPVVATDVGGIPEVVEDYDGGFSVSRDDPNAFADKMIELLNDDNLAQEQGKKGYQRYKKMFCSSRMARDYCTIVR